MLQEQIHNNIRSKCYYYIGPLCVVNTFLLVLIWKNVENFGRIWPDWGNNAWADMAGLGSKGITLQGRRKEFFKGGSF